MIQGTRSKSSTGQEPSIDDRAGELQTIPLLLMNVEAAEKALTISRRKLLDMCSAGLIPYVRIGGSIRFCPDQLRQWIAEQSAKQRATAPGNGTS